MAAINSSVPQKHVEVFLDFDGTICLTDTIDHLHNVALGDHEGKRLEELYVAVKNGDMLFRDSYDKIVEALDMTWEEALEILDETCVLDPGLPDFVAWCKSKGYGITVVSGGFTDLIHHILSRHLSKDLLECLKIEACDIEVTPIQQPGGKPRAKWTITHRDDSPIGYDKSHTLKEVVAKSKKDRDDAEVLIVFAGDGLNDVVPSAIADFVFARRNTRLAQWWRGQTGAQGKRGKWWEFDDFHGVRQALEMVL
ncbi:hypothetical protein HDU93_007155 [Gonapodya sp. JEL0774]|nr:hypothetical protein HDU93_007155 [Gonapodya sp. JEL0774]